MATGGRDQHVDRVRDVVPVAVVAVDREFRMQYVNPAGELLLGASRAELLGRTQWELYPGTVGTELEAVYRTAMATGQAAHFEQYYPEHDVWYEMRVLPTADGLDVVFADITSRKRPPAPEGDRIEAGDRVAARGLTLLTEVTEALTSTLNQVDGVRRLARLVVPELADWCIVSLADPVTGELRDLAVAHRTPERQAAVEAYAAARAGFVRPTSPVRRALASGSPTALGEGDPGSVDRIVDAVLLPSPARDMLRALAPGALAAFPLTARGRVNGVLTLFSDAGTRGLDPAQTRLAEEVAARAGMALDNARLYEERRTVAVRLQEAMLTALPEPDHLELGARYLPAASGERVGGDWYDALVCRSGRTALVVGDVVGHDIAAAAVMGQARTILRTLAWEHTGPPGHVLESLDRALEGLRIDTMATCLYAVVEQSADERAAGLRRLHWSSAGHPPPVLIHPEGPVEVLEGVNDIPLGVQPDRSRGSHQRTLPAGSTVVLFTDGLIERRDGTLDEGLHRLTSALGRHGGLSVEEMLDRVVADVAGAGAGRREDDIAILAVRLHPEDRPRPTRAGGAV